MTAPDPLTALTHALYATGHPHPDSDAQFILNAIEPLIRADLLAKVEALPSHWYTRRDATTTGYMETTSSGVDLRAVRDLLGGDGGETRLVRFLGGVSDG